MKAYFESVRNKMLEALAEKEFTLKSEEYGKKNIYAILENQTESLLLEYDFSAKQFYLSRGEAGCAKDDYVRSQSYLFDPDDGDEMRHTAGVANEFLDTLLAAKKSSLPTAAQRRKKDKDSDESSAVFFVNRIATVLPECREPLLRHKSHYGILLPRHFCEEVVTVALRDVIAGGQKAKLRSFFEFINTIYPNADMDAKAIIMQVIMPVLTEEKDIEFVESIVSTDFRKSWAAAKRYFGKEIKPEKVSAYAKLAKYQADTLNSQR